MCIRDSLNSITYDGLDATTVTVKTPSTTMTHGYSTTDALTKPTQPSNGNSNWFNFGAK